MRRQRRTTLAAPPPDPFGERRRAARCERLRLLGGEFDFESDSARLMRLVRAAYARLPAHSLASVAPRFRVRLVLTPASGAAARAPREPPAVRPLASGALLCGAMDRANFVALTPRQRAALVVVAHEMLRYPYHVRYELLEFAVYVLAARAQRLVPLHAACLGRDDTGVLLMGASGAGKSTVVLHGLLAGLDFLAEDSVLVRPDGLLATGVANFVHLRRDSLRFLARAERATLLRRAVPIRRRSGVEKLEVDLRRLPCRLARAPLTIRALVFLSARRARGRALLAPLPRQAVLTRLAAGQRYAAQQPGWRAFRSRIARLPAYELRRGSHPLAAVEALRELLPQR